MLRTFQATLNTPANTMYKADAAMKTGMAVVDNYEDKTVGFPAAEQGVNLKFVDKERVPTGLNAGRGDMSDYDLDFIDIAKDEDVKTIAYLPGDVFGTDQYVDGLVVNDMLAAGTDGKMKKATGDSVYQFTGNYDDNGHTLARVAVLHVSAKNS